MFDDHSVKHWLSESASLSWTPNLPFKIWQLLLYQIKESCFQCSKTSLWQPVRSCDFTPWSCRIREWIVPVLVGAIAKPQYLLRNFQIVWELPELFVWSLNSLHRCPLTLWIIRCQILGRNQTMPCICVELSNFPRRANSTWGFTVQVFECVPTITSRVHLIERLLRLDQAHLKNLCCTFWDLN